MGNSKEKDGKEYIFHLRKGVYFSDGTLVTSPQISVPFSDVSVKRPEILPLYLL
jgi:ABC-type transport system substrate-binding protein